MSAETLHRLDGLEPDNLLAFMALLGLLRALETAEPDWRPRAYWDEARHPMRPALTMATAKTREDVADAAARGVKQLSVSLQRACERATLLEVERCERENDEIDLKLGTTGERPLTDKQKTDLKEKVKKNANRAKRLKEGMDSLADLARSHDDLQKLLRLDDQPDDWIASLSAEVLEAKGWTAQSTPIKFGSGQMPFVGTLVSLTRDASESEILRSLYGAWEYRHRGESLRLSPGELRLYAHRAGDPTDKEKRVRARQGANEPETTGDGVAPSERGANSLAAVGFLSFPTFGVASGVMTPGTFSRSDADYICWPILCAHKEPGFSLSAMEATIRMVGRGAANRKNEIHMLARVVEVKEYKNIVGARRASE